MTDSLNALSVADVQRVYDEIKAKYPKAFDYARRTVAYERSCGLNPDTGDAEWVLVELDEAFRDLWSIESDAS